MFHSRFRSRFNASRFWDLGGFVSSLTSSSLPPNVGGGDNWGCGWTLCPVVTVLSTTGTLVQPFALVNQSLRHVPVHLRMLCFYGFCKPLRSVAGLLLQWACGLFLLPLSLSPRSILVVALCTSRSMRLLLYLCMKIGGIFELVSSLT